MTLVVFVNGLVLMFFAGLMALNAVFFHDTAVIFEEAATTVGVLGAALCLVSRAKFTDTNRLFAFVLTSSVWLTGAAAGAVPLMMWHMGPVDALFEAMSGITTTGSTVMSGLDQTPRGIILWRAMLQGVGGVGFIVTGMALLPMLKVGGMQLYRTESSETGDKELRTAATFAAATLQIYLVLIGLCALVYLVGGMSPFDAVTHAMTTLSTGGYSGYDASFGHFSSPFLRWSATLFMLLGSLPFAWYIRVLNRRGFASEQVRAMLISLTVVIGVMTFWLVTARHVSPFQALTDVAFNVVSVVSTTGYATTDYTLWGPPAVVGFFFLTAVGGCTGSTAGGAKAMRWLLAARAVWAQLRQVHAPHAVTTVHYEGRRVKEDVMNGVVSFFVMYVATFIVLTAILAFFDLDLSTAASAALTSLANVGPGVGSIIGPAGNFSSLSDNVKLVLVVGMYLGRLEMLTVFVLLTPLFWREVRAA